jgi:D-serine deaminase-like pyridoxal phosphate-dependent protein
MLDRCAVGKRGRKDVCTAARWYLRRTSANPIAKGAPEGSTYRMFGDQFGRVDLPNGHHALPLATRLEIIPPHCDPTVNLYDHLHVVQGDRLVAIWRIEGRGGVW